MLLFRFIILFCTFFYCNAKKNSHCPEHSVQNALFLSPVSLRPLFYSFIFLASVYNILNSHSLSPGCFLLQANLPLLQRELLHCARLAKQNPAQYLAQHEQLLLDTSTTSPVDSSELLLDVNENGKRRTPDRWANQKVRALFCQHGHDNAPAPNTEAAPLLFDLMQKSL